MKRVCLKEYLQRRPHLELIRGFEIGELREVIGE